MQWPDRAGAADIEHVAGRDVSRRSNVLGGSQAIVHTVAMALATSLRSLPSW